VAIRSVENAWRNLGTKELANAHSAKKTSRFRIQPRTSHW